MQDFIEGDALGQVGLHHPENDREEPLVLLGLVGFGKEEALDGLLDGQLLLLQDLQVPAWSREHSASDDGWPMDEGALGSDPDGDHRDHFEER